MDLVIPKKDLLRLVDRCQGVADKKSAMPALANILLAAEGNMLRVSATDLYLSVSGQAEADIATPGSVAVPAKDLRERVNAMPEGPIQISADAAAKTTLKAVGSPRRYTLHGISGSEFPQLPKPATDAPSLEIPTELLSLLMSRTYFSISSDETRPQVNAALFEWKGERARMVSTDGHRLSKMDVTVTGNAATAQMLISQKAVGELRRLTSEAKTGIVTIRPGEDVAFFEIAGIQFSVKLIGAQFPPYQQVIPGATDCAVRLPRLALSDALKAVSLAASDRTGGVKLFLEPKKLRITSESPEGGNGSDELEVDYGGRAMAFGVNARYVLDVLGAIDDDEVVLGVSGELDPAVIRPATESSERSYIAVVMPMRI